MSYFTHFSTHLRRTALVYLTFCLIVSLIPAQFVFADANKLYITPASSQMNINTSFSVNIRSYADTDESVGSVSGTVTYPANLLQVTSISTSGSNYSAPSISQGSGTVGFSASRTPAPSGAAQIFAITFKAVGSGTAAVSFTNDSRVNNATTTYGSGVYTIINPNPPSTSPPPSSSPPTPKPVPIVTTPTVTPTPDTPDAGAQPTPDPTGLIDGVVVNPLYTSSTVSWKVNATSPTATLTYGTSSSRLDNQGAVTKKPDGSFSATIQKLTPGVRYYFAISGGGDGGKSGNYSGTIITRGFPVVLTMTENNIAAKNAQVKIGNRSYTGTANGKLSIGLAAGSYTGTITTDTASLSISLTVETKTVPGDGTAPESQAFSYNLTSSPLEQGPGSSFSILAFIGILLGGTVILGLGFVGFMAYRRRQFESGGASRSQGPTVIVEDGYDWRSQSEPEAPSPSPPPESVTAIPDHTALPHHNNSVHLAEEEPLDMFEQAKAASTPPADTGINSSDSSATGQTPNSPHSTTP